MVIINIRANIGGKEKKMKIIGKKAETKIAMDRDPDFKGQEEKPVKEERERIPWALLSDEAKFDIAKAKLQAIANERRNCETCEICLERQCNKAECTPRGFIKIEGGFKPSMEVALELREDPKRRYILQYWDRTPVQ